MKKLIRILCFNGNCWSNSTSFSPQSSPTSFLACKLWNCQHKFERLVKLPKKKIWSELNFFVILAIDSKLFNHNDIIFIKWIRHLFMKGNSLRDNRTILSSWIPHPFSPQPSSTSLPSLQLLELPTEMWEVRESQEENNTKILCYLVYKFKIAQSQMLSYLSKSIMHLFVKGNTLDWISTGNLQFK